jgi:cytoskeleton protein RodZ
MDDERTTPDAVENQEFRFKTVGEQLRDARTERSLTLNEVAAQTRIPVRHLEALEASDFGALPGSTYSIGFTKAYARFVGLEPNALSDELRTELSQSGHAGFVPATPDYEPADSNRVPPRWLAWSAAGIAVAGLIGYFVWRSFAFSPDIEIEPAAEKPVVASGAEASKSAETPPPANGAVVISATETVWLKIYDGDKKRLFEAEMKPGETYTVPADANNPMIKTGRPQSVTVTVGGKAVPALGPADRTISDVGVSAAALLARKPDETASAPAAAGNSSTAAPSTPQ